MLPDNAREVKARLLELLRGAVISASSAPGAARREPSPVAVGLAPAAGGRARVAVRLAHPADRALLPDLGRGVAAELDVRVIGRVHALRSPAGDPYAPTALQRRVRPLRPGLSVAHPDVTAGTLGGFVRVGGRLAVLSNDHVLADSDRGRVGDAALQPGPADGGTAADRVGSLAGFPRLRVGGRNLVDAAVAVLDPDVATDPGALPGGPLGGEVPDSVDVEPDELVEKVGRTTGHTRGRVTAVEVDGVAVQYDQGVLAFDDQVEIEGLDGAFSAGGDSGSVIWRSTDRAPLGLLFAGSTQGGTGGSGVTYAAPLATVLRLLGAEWVAG